jgi:DNA-binding MarR family transcriptional regulator
MYDSSINMLAYAETAENEIGVAKTDAVSAAMRAEDLAETAKTEAPTVTAKTEAPTVTAKTEAPTVTAKTEAPTEVPTETEKTEIDLMESELELELESDSAEFEAARDAAADSVEAELEADADMVELPPLPVAHGALIDGLMGALTWFEQIYESLCEELEFELITPRELVVLRMVCRYGEIMRAPQITELARALGWSQTYVSALSRGLIAEGLVEYKLHPRDGRVRSLDVTRYGESVGRVRHKAEALWKLLAVELGVDVATDLARVLVHLRREVIER